MVLWAVRGCFSLVIIVGRNDTYLIKKSFFILGQITEDGDQMEKLKGWWQSNALSLVAATDGGLKNKIGTSSYAVFFRMI